MRFLFVTLACAAIAACDQTDAITPVLAPTPAAVAVVQPSPSPSGPTPAPVVATILPTPIPQPSVPEAQKPALAGPVAPAMGDRGLALIVEYEGYAARPEAPDARLSGISGGLGYDWHTVSPNLSVIDWKALAVPAPKRLADTHPYYGPTAKSHLRDVHDIVLPRPVGFDVFNRVDVPRFYAICKKTYPGFEDLRLNARDAVLSLVYNRGSSLVGNNRLEMRQLVSLIKAKDYPGMADAVRRMKRVWRGTEIQNGMFARREGEARLILTP